MATLAPSLTPEVQRAIDQAIATATTGLHQQFSDAAKALHTAMDAKYEAFEVEMTVASATMKKSAADVEQQVSHLHHRTTGTQEETVKSGGDCEMPAIDSTVCSNVCSGITGSFRSEREGNRSSGSRSSSSNGLQQRWRIRRTLCVSRRR